MVSRHAPIPRKGSGNNSNNMSMSISTKGKEHKKWFLSVDHPAEKLDRIPDYVFLTLKVHAKPIGQI